MREIDTQLRDRNALAPDARKAHFISVLAVAVVSEIGPEEVAEVIAAPLAGTADEIEASEQSPSDY